MIYDDHLKCVPQKQLHGLVVRTFPFVCHVCGTRTRIYTGQSLHICFVLFFKMAFLKFCGNFIFYHRSHTSVRVSVVNSSMPHVIIWHCPTPFQIPPYPHTFLFYSIILSISYSKHVTPNNKNYTVYTKSPLFGVIFTIRYKCDHHYFTGPALKIESCHNAKFVVPGGNSVCHYVNLTCHQWLHNWYSDNSLR